MNKMTAEQVANQFDKSADWHRNFGTCSAAMIYRDAATEIRDNLIETDEQRRERFEAWWTARRIPMGYSPRLDRDATGKGYSFGNAQTAWEAFQAALTWRGETKVSTP